MERRFSLLSICTLLIFLFFLPVDEVDAFHFDYVEHALISAVDFELDFNIDELIFSTFSLYSRECGNLNIVSSDSSLG